MKDHDQRFKTLIREFFGDFLRLFFADWAARFDVDNVEWLDKEQFPDPPDGVRRVLDLVAKLPTRESVQGQHPGEPDHWIALVHIEIESPDKATPLRWRMFQSYASLRSRHGLPVLPIAIYLNVGLDGIGHDVYEEKFWSLRTVHFEYLYVGLPALDAIQYLEGDNPLGMALSALMRMPKDRAAELGMQALRRLTEAPVTSQQLYLLTECVQAYLPLDAEQLREFERIASGTPSEGVKPMNTTWHEQGEMRGELKGQRKTLLQQLKKRFGPTSQAVISQIELMSAEDIERLADEILDAKSLKDLGLESSE